MSDMRETLEATFKEIEERAEQPEEVEEKEEVVEEPEVETPDEEEEDSKSPEPEAPQAKTPEKPQDKPDPKAPVEKPKAPEKRDTSLANPPVTWTAKAKAQWAAIPEDVKREIRKREQDALNGITQYKEKAALGEKLDRTIQPYQAYLKSRGTTAERAIEDALNLSYSLANGSPQQRGAILRQIAKQYGADLADPNPEQEKANQVLQPILTELNQLKQTLAAQQQSEQQRQTQTLEQQVTSFAAETDETGAYKHPYFEEVKGLMAALLESGQAKQLGDAYALAVKAHPEISVLVQSEQTLKTKQRDEQRAEKARRNNQVNFQRKPSSPAKNTAPLGSMRETIEDTYTGLMRSA